MLGVNVVMKVGNRVRVKDSVVVYHHPEHRNQAFDIKGIEGEVVNIATQSRRRQTRHANFQVVSSLVKSLKPIYVKMS